jgi:hypothetical protein
MNESTKGPTTILKAAERFRLDISLGAIKCSVGRSPLVICDRDCWFGRGQCCLICGRFDFCSQPRKCIKGLRDEG